MHAALLSNTAWLDEELAQLHHLVVGLMDESVRVTQLLPEGAAESDISAFGHRVFWPERGMRWRRTQAIAASAGELSALRVDLIHALDGRLWPGALRLAERVGCAAVLTSQSIMDLPRVRALLRRATPDRVALTATTEPLRMALQEVVGPEWSVRGLPQGVHPGEALGGVEPDEEPGARRCLAVVGSGAMDLQYEAFLRGAAEVIAAYPTLQLFVDGMGSDQHELWRAVNRMGLLSNISLIPRRLGHREMLLRADALVQPQALGRSRSLSLQAMAKGMPVLAAQDPALDYLLPDVSAWVHDEPTPDDWAQLIRRLLEQPNEARALGASAQQWIAEHRLASTQVDGVLRVYRELLGESIPFHQAAQSTSDSSSEARPWT